LDCGLLIADYRFRISRLESQSAKPRLKSSSIRNPQSAIRNPQSAIRNRMRLAYFTPLPPSKSGIADYNSELLPNLAKGAEIPHSSTA